jgi:pSer/pThr/pTyr-binding forkhead associated (FHA) protein
MFKLVIQDDEGKTTVVPLIRDEITIGRKEGNTIRLTERNVSRRHAKIVRNNGEVSIEDLGSYNGIRVNNARIAERVSLRVSDQVQIGDYKLYLKAEGVEQVDDARTMPIERVDSPIATEVMPSVAPSSPTTPIPAAVVAAAAAGPGGVRPVSGTADTDPAGRPVASAAQVAALSATASYGKLVVISSNFAGKEFDLTRPQMIVGRTDENDIVINHRSISRNHAKVTRDTETGRYTISDLQSSNGVRVNGQDYGKVELRRGDTVDLGHVRLRFVEPGEDFVFSRDAVIADVAEPGGKKGLLVAIVLGVLVLAGVGAFFVLNKKSDDGAKKGDNGSLVGSDKGTTGSDIATGPGSDKIADNGNPENPGSNAGTPGSNAGATAPPPTDEAGKIKLECLGYQSDKKWQELTNCANRLMAKDPDSAKALAKKAKSEQGNEFQSGKVDDAIKDRNLGAAKKLLDKIDDESVYKKQEGQKVVDLEKSIGDDFRERAVAAKNAGKCQDVDTLINQARKQSPAIADQLATLKCDKVAANPDHGGGANPPHPGGGNTGSAAAPPPPANCDADALEEDARQQEAIGQHGAALAKFEKAIQCKATEHRFQLAFMSACNAGNKPKAKYYYKKSGANRGAIAQMCVRNGIPVQDLEAP